MYKLKELIKTALETAAKYGATYSDIRIEDLKQEHISVRNKKVEDVNYSESRGFGVKVIYKGCFGFASSSVMTQDEVRKVVEQAIKIAEASTQTKKNDLIMSPIEPVRLNYISEYKKDPFKVPTSEKLELLIKASEIMSKHEKIKISLAEMTFFKHKKLLVSSEGSYIEQEYIKSGAGVQAYAIENDEMQSRSYPANCGGDFRNSGYEFIEEMELLVNAERIAEEVIYLLEAPQCPTKETTIVLDNNQMAIQIHESIGHPIEYDRVLGMEASFAGTSFLTPEKLNKLKYGSDIVNVFADATIPYGLGSFAYDDEGVPGQRVPIIDKGLFVGYLTSRDTAPSLNTTSMGSVRAENWNFLPIIRMTNINLEPGDKTFEELIGEVEDGIYMCTNKSWSIDDKRWNFQFATEIGWEIKDGKLGKMLKNPTYTDNTVHFWNSCDAIANSSYWRIFGVPNCGKGQPMQTGHVGHGSSPARFRDIKVGILE